MKITIVMAVSLNGIICLEDGNEEFLSQEGGQLVSKLAISAGSLIWGRRTYEKIQGHYQNSIEQDLKNIPKVVVSGRLDYRVKDGYLLAHSPQEAVGLLESRRHDAAALVGGSQLNTAFLSAGLVDELAIVIEPVVIGKGLPLFAPEDLKVSTELLSVEQVNKGELLLRYKIIK